MSPRTTCTPAALLLGGDVLLAVQQRVEHAHLVPGLAQLRTSSAPMYPLPPVTNVVMAT